MTNKTLLIKDKLEKGHSITSKQAFEDYGVTRLAAIIFNLRKSGMPIVTIDREAKDRYDNTVRFAEYRLERK